MRKPLAFIYITAAAFVPAWGVTYLLAVQLSALDMFAACAVAVLLMTVVAAYKKFLLRLLPFAGGLLLVALPLGLWKYSVGLYAGYIEWMWNCLPDPGYERITVCLIAFAVTLPVFVLIRCRAPALILLVSGGALFFGMERAGYGYPDVLFQAFLLLTLLQMVVFTEPGKKKKAEEGTPGIKAPSLELRILTALPVCLVVIWCAGTLTGEGFDPFRALREWGREWGGSISVFGGGTSGVTSVTSVGRDLGGPFRPRGDLMLTVHTGRQWNDTEGPYLRGGIGFMYDGRRWTGDGYGGMEMTGDEFSEASYFYVKEYNITYESLRGTRLYLPPGTARMTNIERLIWYTGNVLYLPEDPGANYSFTAVESGVGDMLGNRDEEIYPDEPWNYYLQMPDELPVRVRSLARRLAVYGDDYYNALAIERYLVENYSYNTDMPDAPSGADFVDNFLFETREGYCTYFATAMAVMCRAAGLPSRYVEGFAPGGEQDEDGGFLYTDEQAHAWCEVYLRGAGWTQFEPTPGVNRVEGPLWFPEPVSNNPPEPEPSFSPSPPPSPPSQTQPSLPPEGAGTGESGAFPWKTVLTVFLPPFVLWIVWLLLRRRRKRFVKMMRALPYGGKQARRVYKYIVWMAKHAHVTPLPHETWGEFAGRADAAWPTKKPFAMDAAAVYSKTCYSSSPLTEEESEILLRHVELLERREQIHLGELRYWLYKKVLSLL